MNLLRDELHAMADEAPHIDLTERAIRGARRRRVAGAALAVAAAVAVMTGGTAVLLGGGTGTGRSVTMAPATRDVTALPERGVGPLTHAYLSRCPMPRKPDDECVSGQWRVVTESGTTYALADTMGPDRTGRALRSPVAITKDGRRIAYYSERKQTFEVRDLASGRTWKAPLKVREGDFDGESFLRLSPDGMQLIYTNWSGMPKPYSVLVDMEKGRTTTLNATWYPVSVGDGGSPITLVKPSRVWIVGNRPVAVKNFPYEVSALGPDGRTLVRLGRYVDGRPTAISTFDALGGAEGPALRVTGLSDGMSLARLGGWVSDTEVALLAVPDRSEMESVLYAVNVHTGRARELRRFADFPAVLPGAAR
ncbi:hypothetical protein [Streptosporangium jomthongense]|uniref:WD40 repeat protein n=1 Tax=Streptosporangium jomthongense TaxID=1193683 RepID=A0ABV8F256_9ACTN